MPRQQLPPNQSALEAILAMTQDSAAPAPHEVANGTGEQWGPAIAKMEERDRAAADPAAHIQGFDDWMKAALGELNLGSFQEGPANVAGRKAYGMGGSPMMRPDGTFDQKETVARENSHHAQNAETFASGIGDFAGGHPLINKGLGFLGANLGGGAVEHAENKTVNQTARSRNDNFLRDPLANLGGSLAGIAPEFMKQGIRDGTTSVLNAIPQNVDPINLLPEVMQPAAGRYAGATDRPDVGESGIKNMLAKYFGGGQ